MNYNHKCSEEDFPFFREKNALIYQMRLSLALRQRKVFIYDDIDENSIIETLYYLHRLIEIDSIAEEKKPIEILINSNGGLCEDGLSLISFIENMIASGYKIITTNMGRAYSMGFAIAISGSERRSYKYARYMYHDVSAGSFGKLETLKNQTEEIECIRNTIDGIIISKTSLTKEQLSDWQSHCTDKYFSAEEAIEHHIADKIV